MLTEQMTDADAAAYCLYRAIEAASTYGAEQAKAVATHAKFLASKGRITQEQAMDIVVRFSNQSAVRQRLEKFGWFARKATPDALETAMRKLQSENVAEVEKMTQ